MLCLALELVGPWVVLGFSVGMEAFDGLLSINIPWIQKLFCGIYCVQMFFNEFVGEKVVSPSYFSATLVGSNLSQF